MVWWLGRRSAAAFGVVVAVIGAGGCAAPDRSAQAEQIRTAIEAMPGVDFVDPGYINDFENGANLKIEVGVSRATEPEIAAVADRIRGLAAKDFTDYRRETSFIVDDGAVVKRGADIDSEQAAGDAVLLRRLRARVPDGSLEWSRDDGTSRLEVWTTRHPDEALSAALVELSGHTNGVFIRSAQPDTESSWDVTLPLSADQQQAIVALRNNLPVTVYEVTVRDGRISGLSVELGAPASAYQNAVTMITMLAPTETHSVHVQWRLADAQPGEIGEFTVCAAPSGVQPAKHEFSQLRDYFDTQFARCAR